MIEYQPANGRCVCQIHAEFERMHGMTVDEWYERHPEVVPWHMESCGNCGNACAKRDAVPQEKSGVETVGLAGCWPTAKKRHELALTFDKPIRQTVGSTPTEEFKRVTSNHHEGNNMQEYNVTQRIENHFHPVPERERSLLSRLIGPLFGIGLIGALGFGAYIGLSIAIDLAAEYGAHLLALAGLVAGAVVLWRCRHITIQPVTLPNAWPAVRLVLGVVTSPVWLPLVLVGWALNAITCTIHNRRMAKAQQRAQGIAVTNWPVAQKETVKNGRNLG